MCYMNMLLHVIFKDDLSQILLFYFLLQFLREIKFRRIKLREDHSIHFILCLDEDIKEIKKGRKVEKGNISI